MDGTDHSHHTLAIIGLGYVGLPLAIEFSKYFTVVGFDIQSDKIEQLKRGVDKTQSVDQQKLSNTSVLFTDDPRKIQSATIKIVTVPTPIDQNNQPDLTHIKHASELVAQFCNVNDIVVYESTVYPGVTETVCAPILESISGLRINQNLFLGYSPERLSPGDQGRGLTDIVKVVSGSTPAVCDCLESIYGRVVSAGIYRASSIQVAEAAKVIENTQRDLNVALMNELSLIFNAMGINTYDVIEAAATKWNFIKMTPGLVGGHCIGVDPYYLAYAAQRIGYYPEIILSGRRINNDMGPYVAHQMIKYLLNAQVDVRQARIGVFGVTFKENVPDVRNSKSIDVIQSLQSYGLHVLVHDPYASSFDVPEGFNCVELDSMINLDGAIILVQHREYRQWTVSDIATRIRHAPSVVFDIKKTLIHSDFDTDNIMYCTL